MTYFPKNTQAIIFILNLFIIDSGYSMNAACTDEAVLKECVAHWNHEAMGAWDRANNTPTTYGLTGKGISIAMIERDNFDLSHPAFKGSNLSIERGPLERYRPRHRQTGNQKNWHANSMLSLMVGRVSEPFELDPDYGDLVQSCMDNHHFAAKSATFEGSQTLKFSYYGGLAPDVKVYVYPTTESNDCAYLSVLSDILEDIETKDDIRAINLSCKIWVNIPIAKKLNILAEKGIYIIQAAGNCYKNIDDDCSSPIEYIFGATSESLSEKFWNRHITVGALCCYKERSISQVEMEIWRPSNLEGKNTESGSSYHLKKRNFVLAAGVNLVTADKNHDPFPYRIGSGTSQAAVLVTSSMALALQKQMNESQTREEQDADDPLLKRILRNKRLFIVPDQDEPVELSVLNLKDLLED